MGIFSVIMYAVSQQTHEIGIRMALGATQGSVLKMVAGAGLLIGAGVVLGLVASYFAVRLIANQIWGIREYDPLTLGAVVGAMILVERERVLFPGAARDDGRSAVSFEDSIMAGFVRLKAEATRFLQEAASTPTSRLSRSHLLAESRHDACAAVCVFTEMVERLCLGIGSWELGVLTCRDLIENSSKRVSRRL